MFLSSKSVESNPCKKRTGSAKTIDTETPFPEATGRSVSTIDIMDWLLLCCADGISTIESCGDMVAGADDGIASSILLLVEAELCADVVAKLAVDSVGDCVVVLSQSKRDEPYFDNLNTRLTLSRELASFTDPYNDLLKNGCRLVWCGKASLQSRGAPMRSI